MPPDTPSTPDNDTQALQAAIAALQSQRTSLGDTVLELALAPLRERLAALHRPSGLQHRQVTVLFADVVGSTAMADGLAAEDTHDVLGRAMRRMADVVQAHGGRVLQFTGDGIKAAFGMDTAREDDAARAVRAGLAILAAGREQAEQALRLHRVADFSVRVGVHTGDVALGAGIDADNTAIGVAVNVAARMEQSAPPGALRISHDTWAQVRGLFDLQAQPPLLAKGIALPMQTYLVRAARDRSGASVERGLQGLRTVMVGRRAELQRMLNAVALAGQTRQLQALTLLGDAGLGKSRLLRELTAALANPPAASTGSAVSTGSTMAPLTPNPAGPLTLVVRSQPDGQLRPWGLLRSLLAVQLGVADTDSAAVARRKVVDGLRPCFAADGERQAQLIGQLSGLDFSDVPAVQGLAPRALRDQAFAAFVAYLQSLAARGPVMLLVEDLHWADDSSLGLLQHLIAQATELPLALIMTSRPPLLTRRPDWGPADSLLPLSPLAAGQSDELAQALLHRLDAEPAALAARTALTTLIVGQAEGNPYYMEELVRRLVDDGVIVVDDPHWRVHADRLDGVRLPGTLVGLLQARLDALPARERQAARQASVIGHVFWDDALQTLEADAPQRLGALQRQAFVRSHDTSDFEGTPERQFDHHLLHQVTYDTLLKSERRLGHGAVARWLTERTQGRGAEFLAMTGEHAARAGQTALAADCFDQAAAQAKSRYANQAAVAWLRRAVALLGDADPGRRFDLLYRVQVIADTVGDRAEQDAVHAELGDLLARHPDEAREARLLFSQALLADRRGDIAASERHSLQAVAVAERCNAAGVMSGAQGNLAALHFARQDVLGARRHLEIGLQWAGRIEASAPRADREAQLLTVSAMVSMLICRFDEARTALTAVLARGEELAMPRLQLGAMNLLALVASTLGHWDESATWGGRMGALAQSVGAQPDLAESRMRQALAAHALGDLTAALHWHEQNLVTLRTTGDRRTEALTLHCRGTLLLALGDAAAALTSCTQALALHQTLAFTVEACEVAATCARCEDRLGQREAALATVNAQLDRLSGELADRPAHETIDLRWTCQQVLTALGDARAVPLLEQLSTDVRARAAELTDEADRDRLIQALPVFRDVVAARRPGPPLP